MTIESLWACYLERFRDFVHARMALHGRDDELIELVRRALLAPGWECPAALSYVPYLPVPAALRLVDTVVQVAMTVHGSTEEARSVLASMPRPEVLRAVERQEVRVVNDGDYEEWGCLIALWSHLGEQQRALELASKGVMSSDEDIRDIAARFLDGG